MVSFRSDPEEWQRLDYRILQNGAVSLYLNRNILDEDTYWLKSHGYVIYVLDAACWRSEDDFHRDVANVLAFPDYYGKNLHAFNDCLADVKIPESGGCAIQFFGFDKLSAALPAFANTILDIIETNSRRFLLTGQRLIALVQSDDPTTSFENLGCSAAIWNPKEWLSKKRRL